MGYIRLLIPLLIALAIARVNIAKGNNIPRLSSTDNRIKLINSPIKSGRLAFTLINKKKKDKDIYVIDFTSGTITPLVKSPYEDQYPSWSPDGQTLVFYSDMCGDREIFSIKSNGTLLRRLTFRQGVDKDPDWSPDGKRIVYYESLPERRSNLVSIDQDGHDRQVLYTSKKVASVPRWSPRGDEIIFSTNVSWPGWDLGLLNLNTQRVEQLTSGYRSYCRANWHPDGGTFVFSYGAGRDIDIWIQSKGDAIPQQITKQPGKEYDALFTEDGKSLFFAGELEPGSGKYQIFFRDLSSGKVTQVTDGRLSARFLSWSPLPALSLQEPNSKQEGLDYSFIQSTVCKQYQLPPKTKNSAEKSTAPRPSLPGSSSLPPAKTPMPK